MNLAMRVLCLFVLLISQTLGWAETAPSGIAPKKWPFRILGLTPVQSGGRIKPLDSFAGEVVLYETGSRRYKNWDPVDLIVSWIAVPQYWESQPVIRVGREDVRRQLGLEEKRVYYSPGELIGNPILAQYAQRLGHAGMGSQVTAPSNTSSGVPRSSPRDQELKTVLDRLGLFQGLVSGQGWLVIPKPAPAAWSSLIDGDPQGLSIRSQFVELLKSYQADDAERFGQASVSLRSAIEAQIPHYSESYKNRVKAESFYNHLRPFCIAWVSYLLAGLLWLWVLISPGNARLALRKLKQAAFGLTGIGISSHLVGMGLRCFVSGRPPVTNMYESVIWVSFGVIAFASILYYMHRQEVIFAVACTLATLGLIAGDSAPMILDPSIHPLMPVLRSNYWLTVHVLTITLGYAAFALTLGLSNMTLFHFLRNPSAKKTNLLNQLTYRAMQFGVVLIAAGTILGGIWADYSWGRFWGWDPKEVWALITLLCYLVILHGRFTSWIGQFGFAVWSTLSFMSVVMAWYGVNFILGVGLHSYGFATGGTPWVIGFVLLQLTYVLGVCWVHTRRRGG